MKRDELQKNIKEFINYYEAGYETDWSDLEKLVEWIKEYFKLEEHNTSSLDETHYKVMWEGKDVGDYDTILFNGKVIYERQK